jgi:general secretion pathway protein I
MRNKKVSLSARNKKASLLSVINKNPSLSAINKNPSLFISNQFGFTLIEVLVALAILSIALTAIIKATSQNIKDTVYLQQKTLALWVANDLINEVRAGIMKVSEETDTSMEEKEMFGQQWSYHANLLVTPNPRIKKINIEVYDANTHTPFIHLENYLYAQ